MARVWLRGMVERIRALPGATWREKRREDMRRRLAYAKRVFEAAASSQGKVRGGD